LYKFVKIHLRCPDVLLNNLTFPYLNFFILTDARRKQKEEELLALALGPRMMQPAFGGPRPMYTGMLTPI